MSKSKELKRLSRGELIEIIYLLRKNEQDLTEQVQALKEELKDRRLKMADAGSIAEASLAITEVFERAQEAADIYLSEIEQRRSETEKMSEQILADAKKKADLILDAALHYGKRCPKPTQGLHSKGE